MRFYFIFIVLSTAIMLFWVIFNLNHLWVFQDDFYSVKSCFIHPVYICLYASLTIILVYIYFLYLCKQNQEYELSRTNRLIMSVLRYHFIFVVFSLFMIINSKKCTDEIQQIDTTTIVLLWGHILLNLTLLIISMMIMKNNFPFCNNYMQTIAFAIHRYHTEEPNYITLQPSTPNRETETPPDNEIPNGNQNTIQNGNDEEKSPIGFINVPHGPRNNIPLPIGPPPQYVVDAIEQYRTQILESKKENPNTTYKINITMDGFHIVETE